MSTTTIRISTDRLLSRDRGYISQEPEIYERSSVHLPATLEIMYVREAALGEMFSYKSAAGVRTKDYTNSIIPNFPQMLSKGRGGGFPFLVGTCCVNPTEVEQTLDNVRRNSF